MLEYLLFPFDESTLLIVSLYDTIIKPCARLLVLTTVMFVMFFKIKFRSTSTKMFYVKKMIIYKEYAEIPKKHPRKK